MSDYKPILTDSFGRFHNYLRISLTERCNLRCTYCMPEEGVTLTPKEQLMTADEVVEMATVFVKHGVSKIRLTGGEPLVRKDFAEILHALATLPVKLSLTTNALLADKFVTDFKKAGLSDINVSLDSLSPEKFKLMTRRDQFYKTFENLKLLIGHGFNVKINAVLMKFFNEDEVVPFIKFTELNPVSIRFIEFMPFDGNRWSKSKLVAEAEVLARAEAYFGKSKVLQLQNEKNFISRNYKINGYKGNFGIISSVTNPFCDGCNRIRLTADGKIKNCLFSNNETDILTPYRKGEPLEALIQKAVLKKMAVRAGMDTFEKLNAPELHNNNRSMITIGG